MKSRDRSVVALLVVVVVAIGGYLLLVQPEHQQSSQLKSQITTAQNGVSQAEVEVQSGLAAQRQYKVLVAQLKAIKTAVPSDDQIPQLIDQLQAASTRNQVSFQAVSVAGGASDPSASTPTSVTTSAAFPSQSFSLSFTGNYFSVARLLGTLASFVRADDTHVHATGRLISISTLSLSPGGSAATGGSVGAGDVTALSPAGGTAASAATGDVTAAVTALDYDVPTALTPSSATAVSSATSTSTATPAADVTP